MGLITDKDGDLDGLKVSVVVGIFLVALVGFFMLNPVVMIDAGERGVVLEWGAVTERILGEGIHMVMPIAQSVKELKVIQQKVEVKASASSKDLQTVSSQITVNYNLDASKVNRIYQNYRFNIDSILIGPAISESLKAVNARYTAEELITKRETVKKDLETVLKTAMMDNGVIITDVFIRDFDFSDEFNKAIEAKVTAEQEALREKNKLQQIKYEAEQKLTTARAEAESIRIQAQAVTQQGGKDYVQLKAIEKWNGQLPTSMIPGGTVPFINLNREK